MSNAATNQEKIRSIRQRMKSGELSYEQAKRASQPIIDDINEVAKRLAKKYNLPVRKVSFAELMR